MEKPEMNMATAASRQDFSIRMLELLNDSERKTDPIRDILLLIKKFTGFEAVGIRLALNDDYPYYEVNGFPRDFVKAEKSLCARDSAGNPLCDDQGRPVLDCMCGNVIQGRTNPSYPFFTEGGSFWSNCTTELLASTTEKERQARTRNRCNGEGYESVALIPLKYGKETIGLLQLNDKRKNIFTRDMIHFFERIGASIGIAFTRKKAEEDLRKSHDGLEMKVQERTRQLSRINEDLKSEITGHEKAKVDLKHLNAVLRAIRNVNQLITKERDRARLLQGTCDCLTETRGYGFAWIVFLDDRQMPVQTAESGLGGFFTEVRDRLRNGPPLACCQEALKSADIVIVTDELRSHCTACPLASKCVGAVELVSSLTYNGKIYGLLSVSMPGGFIDREEELSLFNEVVGDLAFALHGMELEEKHKKAETSLRDSEKRYRRLFEAAHDGILILDAETGRIVDVNPFLLQLLGYSYDELCGKHLWEIGSFKDIASSRDAFRKLQDTEHIRYEDLPLESRDGRRVEVEFVSNVYLVDHTRVIQCNIRDITERKKAAYELERSERMLQGIFASVRDGILVADAETKTFVIANDAFCRMIGYSLDEILKLGVGDIHPAQDLPYVMEQVRRQLKGEITLAGDIPVLRKDGSVFYADVNSTPIEFNGRPGLLGVFRDITDRKQAETERDELARQRQLALNAAHLGWWHYDPVTKISNWDDRYKEIFGVTGNQRPNEEILARLHPDDLSHVWAAVEAALNPADPQPYSTEYRVNLPDGSVRWVEAHGLAVFEGEGNKRRATSFVGTVEDITERKRIAGHITHLNAVLMGVRNVNQLITREKDRDKLIQETCDMLMEARGFHSICIVLIGGNAEIPMIYAGAGKNLDPLYGMIRKGVLPECGRVVIGNGENMIIRTGNDAACYGCPVQENAGTRDAVILALSHERKTYGFLLASLPEGMGTDPEEQGLLKEVAGDIAFALHGIELTEEREHTRAEKEEVQNQLIQSQKMEAIGTLAGGVAHDFNNLLTVIKGNVELGMLRLTGDNPLYADMQQVKEAADRAADLTRQLLIYSRKQPMNLKPIHINDSVNSLLKMLKRLIGEDVEVRAELDPHIRAISADKGNIEQVIMNLAVNARDAMPSGGTLTIRTENSAADRACVESNSEAREGRFVKLSIEDTGTGMDEKTKEHLFEPFYTTKPHGKGTGLGLSVVYGIVKEHNGWIEVESEPGKGTRFMIWLPVGTNEQMRQRTSERLTAVTDLRGSGDLILVVEDEHSVKETVKRMLTEMNYTTCEAETVKDAMKVFRKKKDEIALVFTDTILPDSNGIELIEMIRKEKPDMKVLLGSGYPGDRIQQDVIRGRKLPFIQKPYDMNELLVKIKGVIFKTDV